MAQVWYGSGLVWLSSTWTHTITEIPTLLSLSSLMLGSLTAFRCGKGWLRKGTHLKRPSNGRPNHHIAGRRKNLLRVSYFSTADSTFFSALNYNNAHWYTQSETSITTIKKKNKNRKILGINLFALSGK